MRSLVDQLEQLLEPAIEGLGYELLCLEFVGSGADAILRLYIDSANGIGLGDCEKVSREVSALMDVQDPITEAYRLEVSSPGTDRPLVKAKHFQQFIGESTKLRTTQGMGFDARRNFKGRIVSCDEEIVVVDVDGESYDIPLADIERARLVPDYS